MKIVRLWPMGCLVAMGAGLGCGEGAADPAVGQTTTALASSKATKIESFVKQTNIVSGPEANLAPKADPKLVNGWGVAFDARTGLAWVSAADSGTIEVLHANGSVEKSVSMPAGFAPTGAVFNASRSFAGDDFIFASEDGSVAGVMRDQLAGTPRITGRPTGTNYKGLTIGTVNHQRMLFVADFGDGTNDPGKVDVFDDAYQIQRTGHAFSDPDAPADFAPFNVMAVGNFLVVTYAKRSTEDAGDDQAGAGFGMVDLFNLEDGTLIKQLIPGGDGSQLNAPWGLALSFEHHERGSVDLLVGNFGDGHINVYEVSLRSKEIRADFEGALGNKKTRQPLEIEGLWGIAFGSGKAGFGADDLYFAAGPADESQGLFGELDFVGHRR